MVCVPKALSGCASRASGLARVVLRRGTLWMGGAGRALQRARADRMPPVGSRLFKTSEAVTPFHSQHAGTERRLSNDELIGAHERAGVRIGKILPVQVYIPVAFVDPD